MRCSVDLVFIAAGVRTTVCCGAHSCSTPRACGQGASSADFRGETRYANVDLIATSAKAGAYARRKSLIMQRAWLPAFAGIARI